MLIVVLITGVAAATAIPRYAEALSNHQVQAAALRVKAELEYARRLAIARSGNVAVQFSTTNHTCSIAGATSLDRPDQPHSVALSDSPYRAQLISTTAGTNGLVTFDLQGRPDQGGVITMTSGGRQRTVTLDGVTGRASVP